MYLLRTRFAIDIVADFLPPFLGVEDSQSNKAIIYCDGMPTVPNKKKFLEFWSRKGYWVIHPRYRGTWESGGEFLVDQPEKNIIDIIDQLKQDKKILSLWDNRVYEVDLKEINIIGTSFGGTTALLASLDARVNKVVCISPVVDWSAPSEDEPLDTFGEKVKNNFGEAYRFKMENWDKLKTGKFFNPVNYIDKINGGKIMIIHAKDDKVVRAKEVCEFAKKVNCKFELLESGGHLSASIINKFWRSRVVKKFLNQKTT
ncbi:MAG: hypothetical protein A2725_02145 [Candidatus Magasanikbacteria bacterium RIFCSPHIGHO2_01_FULL_33_34]|uniref:Peptidase S9 prolyl oligopeptidase catalytic domain-containing protein n=1 Tax=Candidatus Magasanikbacteria bacterium RIFCSPHIGHO2_01_FULL_33_34 TaxID=1798671 RepID=A0A1F6LKA5_9BACT|nr:MAG: hypothetical protein A2725_02145 [Candidatus Magasanikbacteria bacterium RIFCSPHIGHO2_01_FULL_33_34]OGH65569.1 MAG: hypothetical protein A3B83_01720 [Candidatus Magasanikbacteria bacterium RIFCSPHIGHO2_02_FULL_33_17]OGH76279.1 MAG: hypothetical protein A3A89_02540 [Candidatus Magasanikbacteria bacterium RIFCSPLOWO2_01_FULL_33_34]OGH81424.1 MAG: hypothetical protein A3F93_02920 [Candidatus Magasanikbacteria bacterium RIFCSPLOWO2_12_FULL_34_7]